MQSYACVSGNTTKATEDCCCNRAHNNSSSSKRAAAAALQQATEEQLHVGELERLAKDLEKRRSAAAEQASRNNTQWIF